MKQESETEFDSITIHGYTQIYALNTRIKIFIDGAYVDDIGRNETKKINIGNDCELRFINDTRSASVKVRKGLDTHVVLFAHSFLGHFSAVAADEKTLEAKLMFIKSKIENNKLKLGLFLIILIIYGTVYRIELSRQESYWNLMQIFTKPF